MEFALFLSVKKDSGKKRLVIDARQVNKVTLLEAYLPPTCAEVISGMYDAKIFTVLDLKQAYRWIPLCEDSKQYTAFSSHLGHFEYNYCVFGFVNSQATLCRLLSKVLEGLIGRNLHIYVDDIILFSKTPDDHISLLDQTFKRLDDAQLSVNPEKSNIFTTSIIYLGHRISSKCIQILEGHIDSILKLREPATKKQVRSFLGMVNYYRNHIDNYTNIARPLKALC